MMNIYLLLILFQAILIPVSSHLCPPSCKPPRSVRSCHSHVQSVGCVDVRTPTKTGADCGCLWQNYIKAIDSGISPTNKCLTWAVTACSSLDMPPVKEETFIERKVLLSSVTAPLMDIVQNILKMAGKTSPAIKHKEIAKSRKRNGVTFETPHVSKSRQNTTASKVPQHIANSHAVKVKFQLLNGGNNSSSKSLDDHVIIGRLVEEKPPVHRSVVGRTMSIEQEPTEQHTDDTDDDTDDTDDDTDDHTDDHADDQLVSPVSSAAIVGKPFRDWMDFDIPADQFKLMVFGIILLLNILVVLVLIFCRSGSSQEALKDTKPMGDLNPDMYSAAPSEHAPKPPGGWNLLVKKCKRRIQDRKDKKRRDENPFLFMEEVNPEDFSRRYSDVHTSSPYVNGGVLQTSSPYVNGSFHRPQQRLPSSHGIYDSIDDPSFYMDSTYEEPVFTPGPTPQGKRQPYSFKSEPGSEGSSPTKYFPRDPQEEKNKSRVYAIPAGAFITLQDRVDSEPSKAQEEERARGVPNASQNGDEP